MELYWLRPEVALWRTADAMVLDELGLDRVDLDLGCGNGMNSYLLSGGTLPAEIDEFQDVADVAPEAFLSGNVDVYDVSPQQPRVAVPEPPRTIRYGLDWKQNLLDKAVSLSLYEQLIRHDADQPLPLPDREVSAIFSNVLYWLERTEVALGEFARVLKSGGTATVLVPDATLREFYVYHRFLEGRGWNWIAALDMGRHTHIKHHRTAQQWEEQFRAAGLRVKNHRAYLSGRLIEIHEIGLRPLSPVLVKMANRLTLADRMEIKREWVDYCMALAMPLFTSGWLSEPGTRSTFHAYVLEHA